MAESSPPSSPPLADDHASSLRVRAARRYVLCEEPAPLAKVFSEVGALIYGVEWKDPQPHGAVNLQAPPLSDSRIIAEVQAQMRLALGSGILQTYGQACVDPYTPTPIPRSRVPPVDDEVDDVSTDNYRWMIEPSSWATIEVRWMESLAFVPSPQLYTKDSARNPLTYFFSDIPPVAAVAVFIINSSAALRKAARLVPLPDDKWLGRYDRYASLIIKEATTAGWRYIAAARPENLQQIDLVKFMLQYLIENGFLAAAKSFEHEKALGVIARKMLEQLDRQAILEPALLNSSPHGRPLPKPQLS